MKTFNIILSILFILFFADNSVAQNNKKNAKLKKVRLKIEYLKQTDGTKVLKSKLYWKDGKKFMPVVNQDVTFFAEGDTVKLKLGTIKSNEEGFAVLYIEKGVSFPVNSEGVTTFTAKMKKGKEFKSAKRSVDIKDATLNVTLDIQDTVKYVEAKLTTLNSEGESVPIQGTEIFVYVKRLYSLFKVANGVTDENGQYKVNFPNDIPGDSIGNLHVIVKVLDSDDFGNIEYIGSVKWGTVVSYAEEHLPRALWTGEAPFWMIIATLIILLGAWFNFLLAVYKVIKIKSIS